MATVRQHLAQVLDSSEERIRISRILRNQSRESIRRSHEAVLHSQEAISRCDRVIHDMAVNDPLEAEAPSHRAQGGPKNLLELIQGQTLESVVVVMDGKHFVDCFLSNCVLEYSGQALVLESTQFSGCSFRFKGEAALTMNFLGCFGLAPGSGPDCTIAPSEPVRAQRPN